MISAIALSLLLLPAALSQTTNPGGSNTHLQCHTSSNAWPKLWLDVVLLIDNSAAQTKNNFDGMIAQIQEIWQPNSGGPIVGLGQKNTRVSVVTFDTTATVVANFNQINSNGALINVLSGLRQTTASTVDGSNALQTAGSLLATGSSGKRPYAPNVVIIYTADWAGNDACQIAQSILQTGVILAVRFKNRNEETPAIPACVYSPGEIYDATNPNLDVITLTSLSYANCFCVGQSFPGNHGKSVNKQAGRADHQVWYQFWLPRSDGSYYLRDKWAECVQETTSASSNQLTATTACHADRNYIPNVYNLAKHQFLLSIATQGQLTSQWIGLQYDSTQRLWFWDNYDRGLNITSRTPANPGDFTYWNANQPDTTGNQYCVREVPGVGGFSGYRWSTVPCTGFQLQYHTQYLCQQAACDAYNFCSNY